MGMVWDGLVRAEGLSENESQKRASVSEASFKYQWDLLLTNLSIHRDLINTTRPGGTSLFAPLHRAAHGGAPAAVVSRLIDLGAWRTLRNAMGERPVDVAARRGHTHLLQILDPVLKRIVPGAALRLMQQHFHQVILGRAASMVHELGLRLPELEPLLEFADGTVWFAVPGMYGGFSYLLERDGADPLLVSESWCRVAGGSGQRHEVTSEGSKLVAEGFV